MIRNQSRNTASFGDKNSFFSLEKQPDYDCRQLYLNTLTISLSPPTNWLHLFCIPVSEKPHLLPICSKSIIMVQNSKIWNRKRTFICFSVLFLAIISKPCRQKMRFRLSCADNQHRLWCKIFHMLRSLFFYIFVNFLPFLMLFQMIGLYQYALETKTLACFGIL